MHRGTSGLRRWAQRGYRALLFQGSRDNMSVILVCMPGAPKVSPEAVKKEAELDKYLESRVEGGASRKASK